MLLESNMVRLNAILSMVRYEPHHYPIISEWYEARGLSAPEEGTLSSIGYMADNRAAGFIYTTNSNMAMIEGIISDPMAPPSLRKISVARLCRFLTEEAQAMGYTNVFCLTQNPSIEAIARNLGFKGGEFKLLAKSFNNKD